SFSLSLRRRPPISPLFPYTSSSDLLAINGMPIERGTPIAQIDVQLRGEVRDNAGVNLSIRRHSNEREIFVPFDVIIVPSVLARVDRKSTRLNSSHVKISYAVCCLKK